MTALLIDEQTVALDDELCVALYLASRAMTATYRPLLDELDLTYPQYLVLRVLWESDVAIGIGDLGRRLHLESNTLSPLVKRLETSGLVTRVRREDDERAVTVVLTRAGRAMQKRAARVPDEICRATGLDSANRTRLVRKLRKLTGELEAQLAD